MSRVRKDKNAYLQQLNELKAAVESGEYTLPKYYALLINDKLPGKSKTQIYAAYHCSAVSGTVDWEVLSALKGLLRPAKKQICAKEYK